MPFNKKYTSGGLKIMAMCVVCGAAMPLFTCKECYHSPRAYFIVALFSSVTWYVLWMGNWIFAEYIETKISWVDRPITRLLAGIAVTSVFSLLTVLFLLFSFEQIFAGFRFGDFIPILVISIVLTFMMSLALHSRSFLLAWRAAAIKAEKFESDSIRAQYESLKNQVNPHFLFNTLNALTHLVYEDRERAVTFIKQLSDVYRYVLDTRDREVVPLADELAFLQAYLSLQTIRFGKNLDIRVDVGSTEGEVAPLALQLLVENAIKHNIISREKPLFINIRREDGFIVVENNLHRKPVSEETLSGLGLDNIRKRYSFLTDRLVAVEESAGKFQVRIPVLKFVSA